MMRVHQCQKCHQTFQESVLLWKIDFWIISFSAATYDVVDLFRHVLVAIFFFGRGDMEMEQVKELAESGPQEGGDQRLSNITADAKGYTM